MLSSNKEQSAEKYISKHHIDFYFEDAVKQMLICKSDNLKIKPDSFLHQYFLSLKHGTHTLYREYKFIHATPWNRASFVKTFWLSFHWFQSGGDLLRAADYFSLIRLLCPDFRYEIIQRAAKIVLFGDGSIDDSLISFADFVYAFQLQFYYDEFVGKCKELFKKCTQLQNSTSTSKSQQHCNRNVKSTDFLQVMKTDIYTMNVDCALPPEEIVMSVIQVNACVTISGFLTQLSRNNEVCKIIGALKDTHLPESHVSF